MATRNRLDLQKILENLAPHVYYQPPENFRMKYPCIVYEKADEFNQFANNKPYVKNVAYDVTVITKDPDSPIPDLVGQLMYSSFNRAFNSDNLHHFVYRIYY